MKKISKRVLAVVLILAILLPTGMFGVTSTAQTNIPSDAVEFNGHYYKVYYISLTWTQAKEYCENLGGHLATITSQEEQSFLETQTENINCRYYWLGGTDSEKEDEWKWITGEPFTYENFDHTDTYGEYEDYVMLCSHNKLWYQVHDDEIIRDSVVSDRYRFICEWESSEQFPSGYNFETDRWKFENINETIDRRYFYDMFGSGEKGNEVYDWMENGETHGHCFGMAVSTTATLMNCPYVTDYISWTSIPYQKLSSVNKGTTNLDLNISAKDYIKYCHIYQGSSAIAAQRDSSSHQGIQNVYSAVANAARNNTATTGIAIDIWGGYSPYSTEHAGHTIYAIGVDGNDILVNDSNDPGNINRIHMNDDSWNYSCAGWTWDSSNGSTIDYVDDVITPYLNLRYKVPVKAKSNNIEQAVVNDSYTEYEEINGTTDHFSTTIKPVDTDKLLVVAETDSFDFTQSEDMYAVSLTEGISTSRENQLYWLNSGNEINAVNTSDDESTLKLVGNDLKITADLPAEAAATMTISDETPGNAEFTVNAGDELSVSFLTHDEDNNAVETTISGTASGDTVTAYEVEDGIEVEGLNDITVTLETADGTDETTAKAADGEKITITVDDENNTVSTDWKCKHPDENHDGICDNCGEDFTKNCTHFCHSSNKFIQFIYKICRFLWKIFGVNKYCACGKAHY